MTLKLLDRNGLWTMNCIIPLGNNGIEFVSSSYLTQDYFRKLSFPQMNAFHSCLIVLTATAFIYLSFFCVGIGNVSLLVEI